MRLGTMLDYSRGFKESADQTPAMEAAGVDVVLVAEAYGFDAPSQMGYIAALTERMEIASGIVPVYSRTPALIAQTAAGIDALSGGRAILGLGASGPQVIEGWHGVPYTEPLQRTREVIGICRAVWRRERLVHDGLYRIPLPAGEGTGLGKPLKLLTHPRRARIPIWLAALGPRNVEMTAEVADGWLPTLFVPEWAERVWGEPRARGASRRSPELGALEVAAGGLVVIGDGVESWRDLARPHLALYIGGMGSRNRNFYNDLVRRYGFEEEARVVQDLYLDGRRQEAAAAVPDELVEKTTLVGPAGYVRDRIDAYRQAGVTVLLAQPGGDDPLATLRQLKGLMG
jgi:F420-dependent oxidoreductase-like protein